MGTNVYELVTNRIIEQINEALENGEVLPWEKPWRTGKKNGFYNYTTGHQYSGINTMLLDPACKFYLTWNQIQELKKKDETICLRKGSKALLVVFWKRIVVEEEGKDKNGKTTKVKKIIPYLRYYNVFRASDVENLPAKTVEDLPKDDKDPLAEGEAIKALSVCPIRDIDGGNRAFYTPSGDYIEVPALRQFTSPASYYSTLFHEMIHSTGHESRLKRITKHAAFGSEDYSQEELTAEIGASMLRAKAGIDFEPERKESKAYILGWLKALRNDAKMVVYAAGRALKAVNYITHEGDDEMAVEAGE